MKCNLHHADDCRVPHCAAYLAHKQELRVMSPERQMQRAIMVATSLTAVIMRRRDTFDLANLLRDYLEWFAGSDTVIEPNEEDMLSVLIMLEADGQIAETDVGRWLVLHD